MPNINDSIKSRCSWVILKLSGTDPGFLERGFIKVMGGGGGGVLLCRLYLIFLKCPMKIKFGYTETKFFRFHRIFKKYLKMGAGLWEGLLEPP